MKEEFKHQEVMSEHGKKEKKEKRDKSKKKSKKEKKDKKGKKEKKHKKEQNSENILEVSRVSDRIPVIMSSTKNQNSKVIDLNSSYQKPWLFPNSRNSQKALGKLFS